MLSLPGGEGKTWRAGPIVLKPDGDAAYVAWMSELGEAVAADGRVRVAVPRRAATGAWVLDGWWAMGWLEGEHRSDAWEESLAVSDAFHSAVAEAGVSAPDFLRERMTPWAIGDRVAWGEQSMDEEWPTAVHEVLRRLAPHLSKRWTGPEAQPVHADIGGNILFAEGLPPAVIDLSMYERPAAYANAVLVADAVAWSGAPLALAIGFLARQKNGDELLARAIAFRVATAAVLWRDLPLRIDAEAEGYRPLLAALED